MSDTPSYETNRWTKHFEEIDLETARLAVIMDIPILDPGVIDRILGNDASVCGKQKPRAFAELRAMMMMHAADQLKATNSLGCKCFFTVRAGRFICWANKAGSIMFTSMW